jgi:hypothetical protein
MHLLAYARAATFSSCLERTGLSQHQYGQECRKARACGVHELLEKFLQARPPFQRTFRQKGYRKHAVADNFFIPTDKMLDFRVEAQNENRRQKLRYVLSGIEAHPGYREWFLDWTNPRGSAKATTINAAEAARTASQMRNSATGQPINSTPAADRKQKQERGKPARVKHEKWAKWRREEGLSYQQIARRETRESGLHTSEDTVKKALKRLLHPVANEGGQEGGDTTSCPGQ